MNPYRQHTQEAEDKLRRENEARTQVVLKGKHLKLIWQLVNSRLLLVRNSRIPSDEHDLPVLEETHQILTGACNVL